MEINAKVLEWLGKSAIKLDVALSAGMELVSSIPGYQGPALPDWASNYPGLVSAVAFRWNDGEGREETQLKPWPQPLQLRSGPAKYVWRKGMTPVINVARSVPDGVVLLVEGTKQHLAAASWAPDDFEVRGLAGCRMWDVARLAWAENRSVVIVLDADAGTNPDVYDAGLQLADALKLEGAAGVTFARLPGGGKEGLDDVLAGRPEDTRGTFIGRLVANAKSKPADKRPTRKAAAAVSVDTERRVIDVGGDKLLVIKELQEALLELDQNLLFEHGGVLSRRNGTVMTPVTRERFNVILSRQAQTVMQNAKGELLAAWPDDKVSGAVLEESERFSTLERLSTVPFVRPDGTLCQTPGYDDETQTYLALSSELEGIEVPETPDVRDVGEAVQLLTEELLGDFPFPADADRAGALALLLTPFIRHLVPLVPLAVVDGKEAGSGKNLLADCLAMIVTGKPAEPLPYTTDDAEHRKVITSAFRGGASLFVFDEAHSLEGTSFARAITSVTYTDRVLGGSNMAEYPNQITWVSLGNQVEVKGDMSRRVHRIGLSYDGESPENRDGFRHADLRGWVQGHRRELVRALLVLVRAWFAEGQPVARMTPMGSFEIWQKVTGGVLLNAGVTGFLDGLKTWRSETDHTRSYWSAHLRWLGEEFPEGKTFTASQVCKRLLEDDHAEYPGFDFKGTEAKSMPRVLGQQYAKVVGRWLDGRRLVKDSVIRHTIMWRIEGEGGETRVEQPKPKSTQPKTGQTNVVRTGGTLSPAARIKSNHTPYVGIEMLQRAGVEDTPELTRSPTADVLALAAKRKAAVCVANLEPDPDKPKRMCGQQLELTPPSRLWAACRRCHPASFGVDIHAHKE